MICWPVCWLLKASFFKQTKIVNWNFENHKSPPCFLKAQLFQALVKQGIEGAGKVMKQITSLTCSTRKTLRENEGGSNLNMFRMRVWNHHFMWPDRSWHRVEFFGVSLSKHERNTWMVTSDDWTLGCLQHRGLSWTRRSLCKNQNTSQPDHVNVAQLCLVPQMCWLASTLRTHFTNVKFWMLEIGRILFFMPLYAFVS